MIDKPKLVEPAIDEAPISIVKPAAGGQSCTHKLLRVKHAPDRR